MNHTYSNSFRSTFLWSSFHSTQIRACIFLYHLHIENKLWCLACFLQVHLVLKFPEKQAGKSDWSPSRQGVTPWLTCIKLPSASLPLKCNFTGDGMRELELAFILIAIPEFNIRANFSIHSNIQDNQILCVWGCAVELPVPCLNDSVLGAGKRQRAQELQGHKFQWPGHPEATPVPLQEASGHPWAQPLGARACWEVDSWWTSHLLIRKVPRMLWWGIPKRSEPGQAVPGARRGRATSQALSHQSSRVPTAPHLLTPFPISRLKISKIQPLLCTSNFNKKQRHLSFFCCSSLSAKNRRLLVKGMKIWKEFGVDWPTPFHFLQMFTI